MKTVPIVLRLPYITFNKKTFLFIILFSLLAITAFFHLWKISTIPPGLYQDEAAIGYNAHLIAHSGHDEYGRYFPLFFASFNDFKSPIYIYTTALLFRIFGSSVFLLRLVSFLYFAIFLLLLLYYIRVTSKISTLQQWALLFYAAIAGGLFPWFFAISRVSFEVISQPAIMISIILLTYLAFTSPNKAKQKRYGWLLGLILGTFLYSYATARLLAPAYTVLIAICFWHTNNKKVIRNMIIAFVLLCIPMLVYWFWYPALLDRFREISIVSGDESFVSKFQMIFNHYIKYFSPSFLIFAGDMVPRHATGITGMTGIVIFILALLGVPPNLWSRKTMEKRFYYFLLFGTFLSPLAASLTAIDKMPHALRSATLGVFLLVLSIEGVRFLLTALPRKQTFFMVMAILWSLSMEQSVYMHDYFTDYVTRSRKHFQTWGLSQSLMQVKEQKPSKLYVSESINYANVEFLIRTLGWDDSIEVIHTNSTLSIEPGTCAMFISDLDVLPTESGDGKIVTIPPNISHSRIMLHCYMPS